MSIFLAAAMIAGSTAQASAAEKAPSPTQSRQALPDIATSGNETAIAIPFAPNMSSAFPDQNDRFVFAYDGDDVADSTQSNAEAGREMADRMFRIRDLIKNGLGRDIFNPDDARAIAYANTTLAQQVRMLPDGSWGMAKNYVESTVPLECDLGNTPNGQRLIVATRALQDFWQARFCFFLVLAGAGGMIGGILGIADVDPTLSASIAIGWAAFATLATFWWDTNFRRIIANANESREQAAQAITEFLNRRQNDAGNEVGEMRQAMVDMTRQMEEFGNRLNEIERGGGGDPADETQDVMQQIHGSVDITELPDHSNEPACFARTPDNGTDNC